jgi:hypothetical protein
VRASCPKAVIGRGHQLDIRVASARISSQPLRRGGLNDSTGSKGRDDCCVIRLGCNIAARTQTALRARPSGATSVRQGPNSVAPGAHSLHRERLFLVSPTASGSTAHVCFGPEADILAFIRSLRLRAAERLPGLPGRALLLWSD